MPYLLNNNNGANLRHPSLGVIPPRKAIKITEKEAKVYKSLANAIVFDGIHDLKRKFPKEGETLKEVKPKEIDKVIAEGGDILEALKKK